MRRSVETKFAWRGRGCYKSTLLALPTDSPVHDCRYAALPRCAKLSSREAKQNCIAEAVSSQRGGRLPGTPRSDPLCDRGSPPDQARDIEKRYSPFEICFACIIHSSYSQLQNCCGSCRQNMREFQGMSHSRPWKSRQHHLMKLTRGLTCLMVRFCRSSATGSHRYS